MRHSTIAVSLLTALLASPAIAGTPIDQTRPLDPTGRIDIENVKGRIQVRAWDRPEVKVTGTLGDGVEKLEVEGDAQHLVVKVRYPNNGGGWGGNKSGPTDLQLNVPVRAELDISAVSSEVDVAGVAPAKLAINGVSGNVVVAAAPKEIDVETVSGDLRLTVNSGSVEAQTVSGKIVLRGRMNGEIKTETVSGDIDIAVNGERTTEVSSSTVSGNATVRTALAPKGEISMESVSGNVLLVLPSNVSAQARGESFSGRLSAPGVKVDKPRYGPGASFNTQFGSGDGEIRIETFSGNADIKFE